MQVLFETRATQAAGLRHLVVAGARVAQQRQSGHDLPAAPARLLTSPDL